VGEGDQPEEGVRAQPEGKASKKKPFLGGPETHLGEISSAVKKESKRPKTAEQMAVRTPNLVTQLAQT